MDEQLTFEKASERLEGIVRQLEGDSVALEDALRLFEDGVSLSRLCARKLDEAERRILELTEGPDQTLSVRGLETPPEAL